MGLFGRKKDKPRVSAPVEPETISMTVMPLSSGWRVTMAGASHRQDAIEGALTTASPTRPTGVQGVQRFKGQDSEAIGWLEVILIRDPANKHDKNAVAVLSTGHGQLGFLPAKWAAEFQEVFAEMEAEGQAKAAICPAYIRRNEGGNLAVVLCLATANFLLNHDDGFLAGDDEDE